MLHKFMMALHGLCQYQFMSQHNHINTTTTIIRSGLYGSKWGGLGFSLKAFSKISLPLTFLYDILIKRMSFLKFQDKVKKSATYNPLLQVGITVKK